MTKALATVRDHCPATHAELGAAMQSSGISKSNFDPTGLEPACEVFGKNFGLGSVDVGPITVYAKPGSLKNITEFFRHCRRLTSNRGCANFDAVCDDLQIAEKERANFRRVAMIERLCEWVDDERRWLVAPAVRQNRLANVVKKVLSVCPELNLSELRRAVARSRGLTIVPPVSVLGRFVERFKLATVTGNRVLSTSGFSDAIESGSAEQTMVAILRTHGPVLAWDRFQELCVASEMNPVTFSIYLSVSPVIARLTRGIYSIVGANVPPGLVEDTAKEVAANRKTVEWGWTARGTLWCALHLRGGAIITGAVTIPAFVANITGGEWQPRLGGQNIDDVIKCKDNFLWGLRRPLSNAGAEPDDVCILEFDLVKRIVDLTIGGEELVDIWESGDIDLPVPEPEDAEEVF